MQKILFDKLLKNNRENQLIFPEDRLLAAVSCGPDSICMLNLLLILQKKMCFELGVAYINHNLRPKEVKKETAFILKTAKDLKLQVFIENIKIPKTKMGIEAQARQARYSALTEIAKKHGFNKIATGHTLDDQTETIILNLLRSTCEEGITAIPVKRNISGTKIEIIRPILNISKPEINRFLKNHKISFCIDTSNKKNIHTRNIVRNKITPLLKKINPNISAHLVSLCKWSAVKEQHFQNILLSILNKIIIKKTSSVDLDLYDFLKYNSYLQWKIVKYILLYLGIRDSSKYTENVFAFLSSNKQSALINNITVIKRKNKITFHLKRPIKNEKN
ncbi:MAG: tRNA lysidine(34) synthetase TilS [Elusimicrobia bacterium RIFOXYA2_FULL_39_19]|nr:MAG: tRNA lysidine(34) synthetase TilS [Elusimicrobia bacterium RIFOXYA2_FULL_39_19]